jgi:hypothetical protein
MQRHDWSPTKTSKVCSRHFKPEDIVTRDIISRLRSGAVPSQNIERLQADNCGASQLALHPVAPILPTLSGTMELANLGKICNKIRKRI